MRSYCSVDTEKGRTKSSCQSYLDRAISTAQVKSDLFLLYVSIKANQQ